MCAGVTCLQTRHTIYTDSKHNYVWRVQHNICTHIQMCGGHAVCKFKSIIDAYAYLYPFLFGEWPGVPSAPAVCATVCLAQTFGLHLSDHIWQHKSVLRLLLNYTKAKIARSDPLDFNV